MALQASSPASHRNLGGHLKKLMEKVIGKS